mgnify:CR=1 FL=1
MKKFTTIALVLVLTLSLCSCGRRGNNDTTASTGATTTAPTILPMPSTNATLDTVPETTVPHTTHSTTAGTDGTDGTIGEGTQGATDGTGARRRSMPVG